MDRHEVTTRSRGVGWRHVQRVAKWVAVTVAVVVVLLVTGIVKVTSVIGPIGYPGETHQEVEITLVGQVGYKFSDVDPGWFRPMKHGVPWVRNG